MGTFVGIVGKTEVPKEHLETYVKQKIPVLLVEQNAYSALEISNRAYALELGHIVKSGFSQSLLRDSDIIKSYLGG